MVCFRMEFQSLLHCIVSDPRHLGSIVEGMVAGCSNRFSMDEVGDASDRPIHGVFADGDGDNVQCLTISFKSCLYSSSFIKTRNGENRKAQSSPASRVILARVSGFMVSFPN